MYGNIKRPCIENSIAHYVFKSSNLRFNASNATIIETLCRGRIRRVCEKNVRLNRRDSGFTNMFNDLLRVMM